MAKATFSRKPATCSVKLTGSLTRKLTGPVSDAQADELLAAIVNAVDRTDFDAESLTVTVN